MKERLQSLQKSNEEIKEENRKMINIYIISNMTDKMTNMNFDMICE